MSATSTLSTLPSVSAVSQTEQNVPTGFSAEIWNMLSKIQQQEILYKIQIKKVNEELLTETSKKNWKINFKQIQDIPRKTYLQRFLQTITSKEKRDEDNQYQFYGTELHWWNNTKYTNDNNEILQIIPPKAHWTSKETRDTIGKKEIVPANIDNNLIQECRDWIQF